MPGCLLGRTGGAADRRAGGVADAAGGNPAGASAAGPAGGTIRLPADPAGPTWGGLGADRGTVHRSSLRPGRRGLLQSAERGTPLRRGPGLIVVFCEMTGVGTLRAAPCGGQMSNFDVVVIGAGMAGSSAAAFLSADRLVALIEAEEVAGYHTTGRSAALWVQNYGPADVRELTRLSRAFYEAPPAGFSDVPLIRRRAVLLVAGEAQLADLDAALAVGLGLRRASVREAQVLVPALRPGYLAGAAIEEDAFDMDVAAIHQGFLRMLRANGGV